MIKVFKKFHTYHQVRISTLLLPVWTSWASHFVFVSLSFLVSRMKELDSIVSEISSISHIFCTNLTVNFIFTFLPGHPRALIWLFKSYLLSWNFWLPNRKTQFRKLGLNNRKTMKRIFRIMAVKQGPENT